MKENRKKFDKLSPLLSNGHFSKLLSSEMTVNSSITLSCRINVTIFLNMFIHLGIFHLSVGFPFTQRWVIIQKTL